MTFDAARSAYDTGKSVAKVKELKKVFILMYVPYGAPAGDVDIIGVYRNKRAANAAMKLRAGIDYDAEELFVVENKLEG